jgi:hypothetical protein
MGGELGHAYFSDLEFVVTLAAGAQARNIRNTHFRPWVGRWAQRRDKELQV